MSVPTVIPPPFIAALDPSTGDLIPQQPVLPFSYPTCTLCNDVANGDATFVEVGWTDGVKSLGFATGLKYSLGYDYYQTVSGHDNDEFYTVYGGAGSSKGIKRVNIDGALSLTNPCHARIEWESSEKVSADANLPLGGYGPPYFELTKLIDNSVGDAIPDSKGQKIHTTTATQTAICTTDPGTATWANPSRNEYVFGTSFAGPFTRLRFCRNERTNYKCSFMGWGMVGIDDWYGSVTHPLEAFFFFYTGDWDTAKGQFLSDSISFPIDIVALLTDTNNTLEDQGVIGTIFGADLNCKTIRFDREFTDTVTTGTLTCAGSIGSTSTHGRDADITLALYLSGLSFEATDWV